MNPDTKPQIPTEAEELVSLRAKVRELGAIIESLKDPNVVWANMLHKRIGFPEHLKKAEDRVHELEQRLEALESQHNRKGPKFGDGFKAEDVRPQVLSLKLCRECIDRPEIHLFAWQMPQSQDKCTACGRIL